MANFMLYHVYKFQLNRISTFFPICISRLDRLGQFDPPPLGFTISFEYLYITFFIFWDFKKRTTASWSVNFSRFFYVSSSKSHIFPKNFHFFWLIWLKSLKVIFKNFFKLETCDRYQTTANFVLHHVVKFQLNRISTFFAIYKTHFHFRA